MINKDPEPKLIRPENVSGQCAQQSYNDLLTLILQILSEGVINIFEVDCALAISKGGQSAI